MIDKGQWWEFGQDTGVTPLLFTRSAMGFLMTKQSDRISVPPDYIKYVFLVAQCSSGVPVAQWLEHCASSAQVVGSIPREHMY